MVNPSSPSSTFKISKKISTCWGKYEGHYLFRLFGSGILPNFEKVSSYPFWPSLSMLFIQCWKCASGLVGLLSKGTFIPSVGRYRQDVWSIPNLWKTSGHFLHSKILKVCESQKSDVKCAYQHISVNRLHLVLSSSSVSANWSSFDKTGWGLCWATRVKVGAQSMRQLPYILTFWAVYFFCNTVK